ncbi:MAG: chemotaxis protein [Lachnospiraceae bacterium]|nr:chemotaxis protein [Lachnospiraceae bacterium]
MPKGNPNIQTRATDKYQKKSGYKVKAFKLKGDVADRFAEACDQVGVSQAQQITKLMEEFINSIEK